MLNKGEDGFGVLLSPPMDLMFFGGSFEVNFNGPKYQTMSATFSAPARPRSGKGDRQP